MRGITHTGDAAVTTVALAVALTVWPGRIAAQATIATILGLAIFSLAKRAARRARPSSLHAVMKAPDRFSMPSGHATCAWAIAITLSALLPGVAALALCWALAVSISRVVLGVHYPFDVAAGAAIGSLAATVLLALT